MRRVWAFVVVGAIGATAVWYFARDTEQAAAFRVRESATRALGEYLAMKFSGKRVLVISNPFTKLNAPPEVIKMEQAGITGLREGFGKRVTLEVALPILKPGAQANPRSFLTDPETPTPLSYLMAEDAFDKLTPGYDLAISLIGLPVALDKMQCWQRRDRPAFALLLPDLRIIGNEADVRAAVKNGKLAAFVIPKPNAKDQFHLVTPENIHEWKAAD